MRVRILSGALVTSGILACVGVGFGVAQASIPDSSGVIHACYNKQGLLRVIDNSKQGCRKLEERGISWPSTAAAGLTGWQLIQCTVSTDESGNVTTSGSPMCSGESGGATILCPPGKVAVQEAGSLSAFPNTYVMVNADGSGAVFSTGGANTLNGESIQLVCADGST